MDPNDSGYLNPRTTQGTDRSICLVEVLPGIREALHTLGKKKKKEALSPLDALHLLSTSIAWGTGPE